MTSQPAALTQVATAAATVALMTGGARAAPGVTTSAPAPHAVTTLT